MAHLFDENKGKKDFDALIQPKLDALQTAFQNSVNSIYNKFVNQGTTPTAKTPAAISTAVDTLATAKYNAGKTAAEAVTWTGDIYFTLPYTIPTSISFPFSVSNVVKFKTGTIPSDLLNKVGVNFAGVSGSEGFKWLQSNTEYTIPQGATNASISFSANAPDTGFNVTFTYQAKKLR